MRVPFLATLVAAAASVSAQEGPRFLQDDGHIAVFEHDGSSYDKKTASGDLNLSPREALLRRFVETHGDFYDFVVVFTNFDFDRAGANGFYLGTRNDVRGIGTPVFDEGARFGSPKTLQGIIDMGPIAQYRGEGFSVEPSNPGFRNTLGILAHEVGHRWLANVRYLDSGEMKSDLLGRDQSHWSYLLSNDASFLYGSDWEPIGGGRYRAREVQSRYSALDLYLMGFASPEEVPPLVLLRNPEVDVTRLPELGALVSATEDVVALDQIVAAEGEREPSAESSQKDFRLAFVFLSEKDLVASPLDLASVDRIREAFVTTFFSLTKGRGFVDTDLLNVIAPSPATTPDTSLALDWLLGMQKDDGRFEDHPRTSLRDTTVAFETLDLLGVPGEPPSQALAWISSQSPADVDSLARAMGAGGSHPDAPLRAAQNGDGGWGIGAGYRSDPLDSALALRALNRRGGFEAERLRAREFLLSSQLPSGGWSSIAGGEADLLTTCAAVAALDDAAAVQGALAWLLSRQELDGGFGDGPSTPYATACAVEALLQGAAPALSVDRALEYLQKTQRADGSWEGSVFQTASVLHALVPASSANLSIRATDVVLEPDAPEVGETASATVTVRNRARIAAPGFTLELFDGDPERGGDEIGSVNVSALAAGGASSATFSWDTTGLEGSHRLFAIADLAGVVPEANETDNVAIRDVEVLPPLPNLEIQSLVSNPTSPPEGVAATLTARVTNRGSVPAPGSVLRLFEGHPSLGVVVSESAVPPLSPFTNAELFETSFSWETAGKLGRRRLTLVVDPENDLRERIENDNALALDLSVRIPPPPEPDLVLERKDLALSPPRLSALPQDVVLTAFVRNTGANPVPATRVSLYQGANLIESETLAVPGDGGVTARFTLHIETGGTRTYTVRLDEDDQVLERNESNNTAAIDLVDPMDTIDVALSGLTLSSASLTAGEVLRVEVEVLNRGTRRLSAVAVSLFAGSSFASTASLDLAPGAVTRVELTWKANRLGTVPLEVRADPDGRLSELDETNNVAIASVDVAGTGLPNLTVASSEIEVAPLAPVEGEPARVSARIRNLGEVDAGGFGVSFFGGDPERNGVPLGSAAVASLAAGGDVVVSADWADVNLRGTTLVYVVIDGTDAVAEFDETDNRTFKVVDITGLADLAAGTPALRLEPAFPRSGDPVSIEATFANQGEQESLDVTAEIRLDDPETGPVLASETFPLLVPGEVLSFTASWDTTGVEGEHTLFLVLDLLDRGPGAREQREDNNVSSVPVALQDADFFATPLYFSPDGNGVQDEAAFFYRVAAAPASVEVEDDKGVVVRALEGEGSVVWDGRTDRGVLARDGDYFFVVESEGVELARKRVVLDTNRSSVAEALGSDFVSFTNLTCPLATAFLLSGPAFLPDDSAAFFIAREEGKAEYPAGLYRASPDGSLLEPIATGSDFSNLSFFERPFPSQAQRIVSPDGRRALARTSGGELLLMDLETGATTGLGRFASDARWSPIGEKLLVSDFDGIFLYSSAGDLLTQLSTLGAEVVEWSPDGTRIAYRPWEEMVLHVMSSDGSGDRVLAETDAPKHIVDDSPLLPSQLTLDKLLWTREGGSIAFRWFHFNSEQFGGPFEIDLASETLSPIPLFEEVSANQDWAVEFIGLRDIQRFRGRERRSVIPSSAGGELHWSYRDTVLSYTAPPEPGCVGFNRYLVRSLLNGEARFRLTALPSGFGVRVDGTVADRNLDFYRLEYAPVSAPAALVPIQAPSTTPVVDDTITTWLPPSPGDYIVRLTLRDRAGNEVVRLDRVSWSRTLPIAGLRRSPPAISPNGDGVQDEAVVQYSVLEPVNLAFHVRDEAGGIVRTILRDEASLGPVSFAWDGTDDAGNRVEDGRYTIEVSGAELPILVDATPPDIEGEISELYTFGARLGVDVSGLVQDANLEEWSLSLPEGDPILTSVRPVGTASVPEMLVEGGLAIQGLELRARDVAGNRTVVPLTGPAREVRIVAREFRSENLPVGPLEPGAAQPIPSESLLPNGRFGWDADSSFETNDLRFVYGEAGSDATVEIPTRGRLRLSAADFPVGRRFVGWFEADGVKSQEVSFAVGPDALFVDAVSSQDGTSINLVHTIEEELVEGTLFLMVGNEKSVFRSYRPVPRLDRLAPPSSPCGVIANLYMEAIGASGRTYRSTTILSYPQPAVARIVIPGCSGVVDASVGAQRSPESEIPSTASAKVYLNVDPRPATVALELTRGAETTEVARVAPEGSGFDVPFAIGGLPEGPYRLSIPGGEFSVAFSLDQSPPEAAILAPVEGGNVCVVREEEEEWLSLEVSGQDQSLSGFSVELLGDDGTWIPLPTQGGPPGWPVSFFQKNVLARIPSGLEGQKRLRLVVAASRILNEGGGSALFPKLPSAANNGALLGASVRNVVIVRQGTLGALENLPALFSPVLGSTHVRGALPSAASLTVRVYRISDSTRVRTVLDGQSFGTGPFDVPWDGLDDSGQPVGDGEYRVEVVAVNGCGARSTRDVKVEVDSTAPAVEIAEPAPLERVSIAVGVVGTASDPNLDSYRLELDGIPNPPVPTRVENGRLGTMRIGELAPGPHTIRLVAIDRAGNESSTSVEIDVVSPDIIASFGAEPTFVKDTSTISFRLKRDALVILTVGSTEILRESRAAGDHSVIWNGSALADGEYVAHLLAEDVGREEASLTLVVDTQPPSIELTSPSGFAALPATISGSVQDQNLERYQIEIGPEAGALSRLEEDTTSANGALAALVGLEDGRYRILVRASDRAGNVAELPRLFDVDSTPPVVEIRDLASHVSTTAGPLDLKGRVTEESLESYALEVGAGASPAVFVPLASGGSLASPELEASWEVSVLPDGIYTVRLRASDKSGSAVEARRQLVLDGTPPSVEIESPAEGAFASRDASVLGTASDENFAEAVLSLSRGDAPLQEIARFEAPVLGGALRAGLPFEDGDYRLSLTARDLAGNARTVQRSFHLDSKPPPSPEGLRAAIEDRTNVRLTWDPSLDSHRVFRDGVLLAQVEGSDLIDGPLGEGRYVYTVVAIDRAGLESEPAKVEVRIDLTPPRVALRAPDEGERLRALVDVVGTAFSETDFKEYRLSVASEGAPASPTLLKKSPLPVSFGTLFQWEAVALDGAFLLTLEGEDTSGNVATDTVRVVVDNQAPDAPVLSSVSDGEVVWEPSSAQDVAGYLVFRNGRVANAPGTISGDLRPFLVPAPRYVDADLPDGRFCYRIVAMDQAGNLSFDSNEICVFLDDRLPEAILVEPEDGARFDGARTLRAVTVDEDVARVLFQFQAVGAPVWTDVGTDGDAPFEILWDIAGVPFGDYRLRAVATDAGSRTDPDPALITVALADSTAPAVPSSFAAKVDGDTVTLTWDRVSDPGLAGYRLYRDGNLVRTLGLETTAMEAGRPDGLFEYRVSAFDSADNESASSDPAHARVYRPLLLPAFPIFEGNTTDLPGEGATPDARVELFFQGTATLAAETTVGPDGRFVFASLALPVGESLLEARATDREGNRSRVSETLFLLRNEAPSPPAGLSGVVNGLEATLSWTANAETDLSGYVVRRNGESLIARGRLRASGDIPTTLTASGSGTNASRAIDGFPATFWSSGVLPSFLEIQMTPPRHLREVRISWGRFPRDFRVFAEISGRLVPLASVRANNSSRHVFTFPREVRTARIRIEVTAFAPFNAVDVAEVELYGSAPLASTSRTDTPDSSGVYTYGVSAIDVFGAESAPSSLDLGVGDVTPPEPPAGLAASVSLADVALSWTPSPSTDVAFYRIHRDGESIGEAPGTSFTDFLVPDGLYRYTVAAVDADGNESARSSEARAEVSVDSPTAPSLTVNILPEGRALALDWAPSTGPLGVAEYAVFRSTSSGGAGVEIARTAGLGLVDEGLANGVTYFYVVRALDPRDEASLDSNEASGTPADDAPPDPPVFLRPTRAGTPITLTTRRTTLVGRSEPGSSVSVFRGTDLIGEADAVASLEESRSLLLSELGARAVHGMKLADIDSSGIRIWDFETGALESLPFHPVERVSSAAFSPAGDRLAIASGSSVTVGDDVFTMSGWASALEWVTESSIAVVVDGDVVLLDVSTGATEEIFSGSFFDPPRELRLSRGGSRLGFIHSGTLEVVELATRATTNLGFAGELAWLSDEEIVFAGFDGLEIANVVSGTATVVPETNGARFPARLGPGEIVALSATSEVVLVGADVTTLGPLTVQDVGSFTATEDFRVLVVDSVESRARLFSLPGRFELREAALVPGVNEIEGEAADADGNRSPRSAPIEIAFDDSLLPDLSLEGLLAVPAVPATGDVASVSVTVRSQGTSASSPSFVQFFAVDGFGERASFGSAATPAIPAGGSAVVSRAWETAGLSGSFTILAEADPLGTLDERDESNNTATKDVTVVGTRGVGLGISTALSSYSAGQDVEIRVEAVNGGASSDVTLETAIEDARGVRLAMVDRRSTFLGFGGTSAYSVFWNTGSSLAGTYRARVVASRASGASAADEFQIRRFVDVRASVIANRPSFLQGDGATLLATVRNEESNAPLRNLTLSFAVADIFETTASLDYLAMGGSASVSVSWPRIDAAPGVYPIRLRVLESGLEIASASSSLEVKPATEAKLSGTLSLESAQVPSGAAIVTRFEIENRGVLPVAGGSARVELLNPTTGLSTLFEDVPIDVSPGGTVEGEVRLDTAGEPLGRHTVVLSVGPPLASAPVTLFAVPAPPSLNAPAEGASAAQPLILSVNNASNPNGERLLYEFEIYFDSSLRSLLGSASGIPEGTNATAWTAPLELSENERYFWRARARDRFAASDWMPPASLFADSANEPPSPPVLSSPAMATEVATRNPRLTVGNSFDPEGAALSYAFEVYQGSELVFEIASVAEGQGETSADVTTPLDEDGEYTWRARASDGELDSDWMPEASFRVNTGNGAPTRPVALRPAGGVDVTISTPELAAKGGLDPEASAVFHRFEIDTSPSFDTAGLQSVDGLFATGAEVRWTPPMPLSENEVYFWRVRASDGTASSDWSDTATFRVDAANEVPSIPRPESPLEGALVASSTPTLTLVNAGDPEGDALRYDFEVYDGDSLVARIASLREGEGRTAWTVSPRLSEDRTYRFRARARDSELASDWSQPQSFLVNVSNSPPSAPSLGSPSEGSLVSSLPVTLEVLNAVDLDGDALTYRFEVYADPDLLQAVEASGPVAESTPRTSWEMTAALEENHLYYWRALASDGLDGPWMPTARFRFSLSNEAPTAPVLVAPADGATLTEARPILTIESAVDPDGDPLRYVFEIFDESGVLVVRGPEIEDTSWEVSFDLAENHTYFWQALATDGVFSTPSDGRFSFRVDAVEEGPLPPTPIAPANGSTVTTRTPTLVVGNAVSPDGRPLHYHFELSSVVSDENVPEGTGETRWEVPVELTAGLAYSWRARAIDDRGLASDWSESFNFTVEGTTSECPPEWSESFGTSPAGLAGLAGWVLRRETGNPGFEVHSGELESRREGRGALLFQGSGESTGWRNYELRGELELEDGASNCGFGAGVVFYSSSPGEYRLEVTTPGCHKPKARLVKSVSGGEVVLAQQSLEDDFDEMRFEIEVVNGSGATDIRAELEGEDERYVLEVSDGTNPLRAGTVGAWSNFVEAEWDDFRVREVEGFESGISGDEDGDRVCDVPDPICSGPLEVCLDGGEAKVALAGSAGHSGPSACGAQHSYWVSKRTGVLSIESSGVEAGRYRFRLLLHQGGAVRVELENGQSFDVAPTGGGFNWSRPFEVDLPEGVFRFRIRSLVNAKVHVEAFRLECEHE